MAFTKSLLQVMVNDYMLSIALCKFEGFSENNLLVILKRGQWYRLIATSRLDYLLGASF